MACETIVHVRQVGAVAPPHALRPRRIGTGHYRDALLGNIRVPIFEWHVAMRINPKPAAPAPAPSLAQLHEEAVALAPTPPAAVQEAINDELERLAAQAEGPVRLTIPLDTVRVPLVEIDAALEQLAGPEEETSPEFLPYPAGSSRPPSLGELAARARSEQPDAVQQDVLGMPLIDQNGRWRELDIQRRLEGEVQDPYERPLEVPLDQPAIGSALDFFASGAAD